MDWSNFLAIFFYMFLFLGLKILSLFNYRSIIKEVR